MRENGANTMNYIPKIKKVTAIVLAAAMVFSLVACGAQSTSTSGEIIPDFSKGLTSEGKYKDVNILDYVTLPEGYLTMEVPQSRVEMQSDEWDTYYEQLLHDKGEESEMAADKEIEKGDHISFNFKGTVDGVAFTGGSADNVEFVVGSGIYLPEIEEGVVGHKKGDSFEVEVIFPEEYPATTDEEGKEFTIAGKTAVFTITINSIFEQVLTDAKIAEVFKDNKALDGTAITSCDQLKKDFQARTEKTNLEAYLNDELSKTAVISEIPQTIIDNFLEIELEVLENSAKSTGFKSAEDFLKKNGFESLDAYKSYIMGMHTEILKPQMALMAVAETNGIKADHSLCDTVFGAPYEELVENFGEGYVNQNLVLYQALELLYEGAVVVADDDTEAEVDAKAGEEVETAESKVPAESTETESKKGNEDDIFSSESTKEQAEKPVDDAGKPKENN